MSNSPWLTKSRFIAAVQCPKRLWQQCHAPLPEAQDQTSSTAAAGVDVGRLAHRLFPKGAVAWKDGQPASEAITATEVYIKQKAIPAIFEAALLAGRLFSRIDILERDARGTWKLCEVKASTEVKDEHIDDVAFQLYVANECGLKISKVELVLVNKKYIRKQQGIEPKRLFRRVDVTAKARKRLRDVPAIVETSFNILKKQHAPDIEPWTHCHAPYGCEFLNGCTASKPKDWIFHLPRLGQKRGELLRANGIQSIAEIPDDIKLTEQQSIIRGVYRTGRSFVSPGLKSALCSFGPPAHYLDFETMSPAIPLYVGTKPYERLPFQWSLHKRHKDGSLQHCGFLADGRSDPREAFIESLIDELDASDEPVIVYSAFERSTLTQLANLSKHRRKAIERLQTRLRDLLTIVREHIYYAEFKGSYSIKVVGPVVANVSYDDLELVADGGAAAAAFEKIASGQFRNDEEHNLRQALEVYCRRDTLAMVEIHSEIAKMAK